MHEQEYHIYHGQTPSDEVNQAHHCDQDTTWVVETHDNKLTSFLRGIKATEQPCLHDGRVFVVDARQLIAFIAESSGLAVEFRNQKRRQLTEEQRQAKRLAMATINAKKAGQLSTITHAFDTQIGAIAGGADNLTVGGAL